MGLYNNGGNVNPFAAQKKAPANPATGVAMANPVGSGLNFGNGGNSTTAPNWMNGAGRGVQATRNLFAPQAPAGGGAGGSAVPQYGSESGLGILEDRYNKRANGTDPAFEYLSGRGMGDINTQFAAGGSFNSGARGQQISDFLANLVSQREGQLDSLAGGASGEHQGRINSMFNQGIGLAGGQANTVAPYATGAAGAMGDAANRDITLLLNKAGVDSNSRMGMLNFLQNTFKSGGSAAGGRPPGA